MEGVGIILQFLPNTSRTVIVKRIYLFHVTLSKEEDPVKNLPIMQETLGQSLDWEDSLSGGHDNPLKYSCSENLHGQSNPVATVHGVAKSWIQLRAEAQHIAPWMPCRFASACQTIIMEYVFLNFREV